MKSKLYLFILTLLLAGIFPSVCKAITEVTLLTVNLYDGTEQSFIVEETGRMYLTDSLLFIKVADTSEAVGIVRIHIAKMTCVNDFILDLDVAEDLPVDGDIHLLANILTIQGFENEWNRIEIFSIMGQQVYKNEFLGSNWQVDVSTFLSGTYFVRLNSSIYKFQKI
ncbi:MAG: T9SS type A sorting domain-containing protein [Ignavibacteria bacterium]|jgi:hypothetical protein|nr:T9SS type A sorting domain-containing protein [Ignavibacteria bacterium]